MGGGGSSPGGIGIGGSSSLRATIARESILSIGIRFLDVGRMSKSAGDGLRSGWLACMDLPEVQQGDNGHSAEDVSCRRQS